MLMNYRMKAKFVFAIYNFRGGYRFLKRSVKTLAKLGP